MCVEQGDAIKARAAERELGYGDLTLMETVCGALLAAFFANANLNSIDRSRLYVVPTSMVAKLSVPQQATAKACASYYGVRYTVLNDADFPSRQ